MDVPVVLVVIATKLLGFLPDLTGSISFFSR
jgi:hypothetical protein